LGGPVRRDIAEQRAGEFIQGCISDLGKASSDEYTERLLAFVQDMEASGREPFNPLLADIALARALIVHLGIRYGPEEDLSKLGTRAIRV
jgi:hypothetical protein